MPIFREPDVTVEMGWCIEDGCKHRTHPDPVSHRDIVGGGQVVIYEARCPIHADELGQTEREVEWPEHMLWQTRNDEEWRERVVRAYDPA